MPPLLLTLARRGITVAAADGRLAVSPASLLTPSDRVALRAGREELLHFLAPLSEPWTDQAAAAQMVAADELGERLGVPNNHPELRALAGAVVAVLPQGGMDLLLGRIRMFELAVHWLAQNC